jgi:hypothetical protein
MDKIMREKYDYETWDEVRNAIVEHFWIETSEFKKIANPENFYKNWQEVKEYIDSDSEDVSVKEEFVYPLDEWLEEIYKEVKPMFEKLLDYYKKSKNSDLYQDYIDDFWEENI